MYKQPGTGFIIVTRNEQSGNTGRLKRNLYVMLKFTERPKTQGMTSKKNIAFPEGISSFAERTIKPGTPEHTTTEHRTPVEYRSTGGTYNRVLVELTIGITLNSGT